MFFLTILLIMHAIMPCALLVFSKKSKYSSIKFVYFFIVLCLFSLYWSIFSFNCFYIRIDPLFTFNGKLVCSSIFLFTFFFLSLILLLQRRIDDNAFYSILLLVLFFSICGISSHEFIGFYILLECINLCIFIIIKISSNKLTALESALKYLIINLLSSSLFLLGVVCFYIQWGCFDLEIINLLQEYHSVDASYLNLFDIIGVIIITFSFLIKLGIFPFHNWLLDVYLGLFNRSLLVINGFSKTIISIMFYNLFSFLHIYCKIINYILLIAGLFSLLYGSVFLLFEVNSRRFLGLFSLVSSGFFCIIINMIKHFNYNLPLIYLITQSINLFFLIYCISFFSGFEEACINLKDQSSILHINLWVYFYYFLVIVSLIGLPPFIGFLPKFILMAYALKNFNIYILIFIVLISVLNCISLLRLLIYFTFPSSGMNDNGIRVKLNTAYIKCLNRFFLLNFFLLILHLIFCFYLIRFFIIT